MQVEHVVASEQVLQVLVPATLVVQATQAEDPL